VLIEPGLESLNVSVAIVRNTGLVVLWIEDESWVSSDLNTLSLVNGGVELTNDEILVLSHGLGELLPWLGELLAVAAPWGVVLNEDILGGVLDDLLELLSNDHLHWLVVLLWDWLGLKAWGNLASEDIIDESGDDINGQISGFGLRSVLLHAGWNNCSKGWESILSHAHELTKSLLDSIRDITVGEEHLTLVGLSGILESLHESSVLVRLGSEQNEGGLLLSEDSLDLILRELEHGWDHKWLDESSKGVLVGLALILVLGGLELSEEDDGWALDTLGGSASGILDVHESNLVLGGGVWEMSLGVESIIGASEVSNDELVVLDCLCKSIAIGGGGWWARLLGNPLDDGVLGSTSGVLELISVPKV
jgi:hypothetical protein